MKLRSLGAGGPLLPPVGQGTWQLERIPRAAAVAALRYGLDRGLTLIDTAPTYGEGRVEEIVGEAIRGRRDEVYLVTKIDPQSATRAEAERACDESLRRLGADRIDCYLFPKLPDSRLLEAIDALGRLRRIGKICCLGTSNIDERSLAFMIDAGAGAAISQNQVPYHLRERSIEQGLVPFCHRHGIAVVAQSPFASGALLGDDASSRMLGRLAEARGLTARQLALAFLLQKADFVLPRSSDPVHVDENAEAAEIELSPAECEALESAFPVTSSVDSGARPLAQPLGPAL
jgi:diketogulonate reductase-like aldo/keto reductase